MDVFEFFNAIDENKIRAFVVDNQEENLFLEFKTMSSADFASRDDRRNFAKAISGYANSSGGMIVWA